jgi:hypothetical protein
MMLLDAHLKKYGMKHCPIDKSGNVLCRKIRILMLNSVTRLWHHDQLS